MLADLRFRMCADLRLRLVLKLSHILGKVVDLVILLDRVCGSPVLKALQLIENVPVYLWVIIKVLIPLGCFAKQCLDLVLRIFRLNLFSHLEHLWCLLAQDSSLKSYWAW